MARTDNMVAFNNANEQELKDSVLVAATVTVMSFDPASMTVDVQPLVTQPGMSENPPVLGVPVATMSGGGFVCRPWYQSGDTGVIVYFSQDNDNAISTGESGNANTTRSHSATDAVFVGGVTPASGGGYPDNAFVIADSAGNYIALSDGKIEIKGDLNVDGNVTATGSIG